MEITIRYNGFDQLFRCRIETPTINTTVFSNTSEIIGLQLCICVAVDILRKCTIHMHTCTHTQTHGTYTHKYIDNSI